MSAYVVFTREKTKNADDLAAYSKLAMPTFQSTNMSVKAAYGRQRVLEGPRTEAIAILEFPTFEEAEAWYDSPAYQEAVKLRFRGADYRAVIVESV